MNRKRINYELSIFCTYPWYKDCQIYFRGYFFWKNILYKEEEAITFLKAHINDVLELLPNFNGCFSIILEEEHRVVVIADRLRTLPLFYRIDDGVVSISDTINKLIRSEDFIDDDSLNEFKKSILWVSGDRTLIKNIHGIQAAEYLIFRKDDNFVEKHFYYEMRYGEYHDVEQCKMDFWPVYDSVGRQLVQVLNGRTAVIPLSGGADSRMVLDMLKRQEYKRIICFTYGRKDSREAMISKEVAESRGYPWVFVEYTKDMHRQLLKSGEYRKYGEYSGNYTSLPHLQDFAAVKQMMESNLIPKDSVFVPGHTGDLLTGGQISNVFVKGEMEIKDYKYWFRDKFYPGDVGKDCLDRVPIELFDDVATAGSEDLLSIADTFNIRERQAKFIVNSIRTYEYFGYEWLIPLWSNQLMEYWSHVPLQERYKRKLYFECVGEDQVASTNDSTIYKKISDIIHSNKPLTHISRKMMRVRDYYTNHLLFPQMFRFHEYLFSLIKTRGRFTINFMLNELYLKVMLKPWQYQGR